MTATITRYQTRVEATAQNANGVRPSLETKFTCNDSQTVPTLDECPQRRRVAVPELVQLSSSGHGLRFMPTDLSVKKTCVSLQI